MGRPTEISSSRKKKLFHDFSGKELWTRLRHGMRFSGMMNEIMLNPNLKRELERYETEINEDDPTLAQRNKDQFMYETRVPIVRKLLEEDNNWMVRWVSNPKRLAKVNIVKEEFLKYGPSALPDYYKYAENFGAVFRWTENPRKIIIMMILVK